MKTRLLRMGVAAAVLAAPLAVGAASAQPTSQRLFRQIVAGADHACGVTSGGAAMCWGRNESGQLGDGTRRERHTPVLVAGLTHGVRSVALGDYHTCAVLDDGSVKCWGYNFVGSLGDGTRRTTLRPVQVLGLFQGVASIRASQDSTCALTTAGKALCWGGNEYGQLGDGTGQERLTPTPVVGLGRAVTSITLGNAHACGLLASGTAKCWGRSWYGQLGDGTWGGGSHYTPVTVTVLKEPISAIAAGGYDYTCVLTTAGAVKCWGSNWFGQLGFGGWDEDAHPQPTTVPGLSRGVNALSAGLVHSCARLTSGAMTCWGFGLHGELGNGDEPRYSAPVRVVGMSRQVSSMSAGGYLTCALQAGVGKCWRNNDRGEVGDGTTVQRNRPVLVK